MINTQVNEYSEIKDKILKAVDTLCNPVVGTISPLGRNVLIRKQNGEVISTNDGATIAKSIVSSDSVMDTIISIIKSSSLKTNSEVGDGTSTTILLSSTLIREGLKLIDSGMNPMVLKKHLEKFASDLIDVISKQSNKVKTDAEQLSIATISANNDLKIAKDTVKTIKTAGLDGMVFIQDNNKNETELIEDIGFHIRDGMFSKEFKNHPKAFSAVYTDVPVLVTDKRLYYREEAETIIKTMLENGYKQFVVVARDFIGDSVGVFTSNHNRTCQLLLVKDSSADGVSNDSLSDLATYLGGKVLSEKNGKIVDNLQLDDFIMANRVYSDGHKTLITPKVTKNKELANLIDALRKELKDDKDNDNLKRRLASLTNGMVTIKVGGRTPIEIQENIFRFEDAINATRASIRDGYLPGGGVALYKAGLKVNVPDELKVLAKKFTEASIRQIAKNCGKHEESIVSKIGDNPNKNFGYNALADNMEDLVKAGVIDPYKVTEMAINNSISIASQILSSNFIVTIEEDKEHTNESK